MVQVLWREQKANLATGWGAGLGQVKRARSQRDWKAKVSNKWTSTITNGGVRDEGESKQGGFSDPGSLLTTPERVCLWNVSGAYL